MIESRVINYRIPHVAGETRKSDEYRINIPSIIYELEPDNVDFVYLELRGTNDEPSYLYGVRSAKEGTSTQGYYNISNGELKIAERWESIFRKPLHQVAIEINIDDNSFRIYDVLDFVLHRIPELKEQGYTLEQVDKIGTAAVWELIDSQKETIDFASHTPYPGQKFRLVPYDAQHRVFKEKTFRTVTDGFTPRPSIRQEVVDNDELPQFAPAELTIEWDPNGRPGSESFPIYKGSSVKEIDVILPLKGYFSIQTRTQAGGNGTWFEYAPKEADRHRQIVGGEWWGHCLENPEDTEHLTAYIPCNTIDLSLSLSSSGT